MELFNQISEVLMNMALVREDIKIHQKVKNKFVRDPSYIQANKALIETKGQEKALREQLQELAIQYYQVAGEKKINDFLTVTEKREYTTKILDMKKAVAWAMEHKLSHLLVVEDPEALAQACGGSADFLSREKEFGIKVISDLSPLLENNTQLSLF